MTIKRVRKFLKTVGRYGDGDGLYLQVNTPGRGSWLLRYERNGVERAQGLGKLADFSLKEARNRVGTQRHFKTCAVADYIRKGHAAWLKGKKKDGQPCKDSTMRKFNDLAEQYLGRWDLLGLD